MAVEPSTKRLVKAGSGATRTSRTLSWLIRCDSVADTAGIVYASDSTPKRWDAPPTGQGIPTDYVAWDSSVEPHDESLKWFKITTEYVTPPVVLFPNPLDYVAKGGGGPDVWEDTDYDADGVVIKNTAGDFVDPPFQKPRAGGSFWVEFRTTSLTNWGSRSWMVCSATIWGLAAYTVSTGKIEWFRGIEDGVKFWQIRVPIDYNPNGFKPKWKSRGFNYLDGSDKKVITIEDEDGNKVPPNIPQPLDSSGAVVSDASSAHEITTKLLGEEDFTAWGLPDPFDLDD